MNRLARHIAKAYLKKQAKRSVKKGRQLACFTHDLVSRSLILDGQFEKAELNCLSKSVFPKLRTRRTCLDIGANIGNHALAFSDHFDRVIAFEPHPRTIRVLQINADIVDNIEALNFGLSNSETVVNVADDILNLGETSVEKREEDGGVALHLRTLDDVVRERGITDIDFVKIDVEGHELACLDGATDTIKRERPAIVLEVLANDVEEGTTPALRRLNSLGYEHVYIMERQFSLPSLFKAPASVIKASFLALVGRDSSTLNLCKVNRLERRQYDMVLALCEPLPVNTP